MSANSAHVAAKAGKCGSDARAGRIGNIPQPPGGCYGVQVHAGGSPTTLLLMLVLQKQRYREKIRV